MSLGRILVVDDEADVRKSVRLVLTKAGYEVREAEDGEKAITQIRSNDNPFKVSPLPISVKSSLPCPLLY
jgi:two-component system chemotaxis response regulator CheY